MNNNADMFAIVNARIRPAGKKVILAFFKAQKIAYSETSGSLHAIDLARSSQAGIIIAVGGDGTINEVVNGIDLKKQSVLIVPAGSLNCLARSLGISSLESAFSLIKNKRTMQRVDLIDSRITSLDGTVYNRRIVGFVSVGYDGLVVQIAGKMRWIYTPLRYVLSGWGAVVFVRTAKANICINESTKIKKSFTSFLVNNGTANAFSTIKKWDMQDGTDEVQIVRLPAILHFFWAMLCLSPFSHTPLKCVRMLDATWDIPLPLMADGELIENVVSFSMNVRSNAIQLILPMNAKVKR
jgi:diacylglycerol kinase family enzyme